MELFIVQMLIIKLDKHIVTTPLVAEELKDDQSLPSSLHSLQRVPGAGPSMPVAVLRGRCPL